MKFNSIHLEITDKDDEEARIRLIFDPPLPDDQDEIEITPSVILVKQILSMITTDESEDDEDLSEVGFTDEVEEGVGEQMEFQFQAPKTIQ